MRPCSVEGCARKHAAKGLCQHHFYQTPEHREKQRLYREKLKANPPKPPCTVEGCHRSQTAKGVCLYHWKRNPENREKVLQGNRDRYSRPEVKAQHKAYFTEHNKKPETQAKTRDRHYKKNYGLTLEDFNRMETAQQGLCKICKRKAPLVVDHCHQTGKVRGLLCNLCNLGLGGFQDNTEALTQAILYLQDSKG